MSYELRPLSLAELLDRAFGIYRHHFLLFVGTLALPSLLMLAINVVQQIQRDARMREAAAKIHAEVGHLMDDIKRLQERVLKLQQHHGQAGEDLRQILISAEKVEKRGTRIREVEFDDDVEPAGNVIPAPIPRKLQVGE